MCALKSPIIRTLVKYPKNMVTIGGDDFQPGCLADRLLTGLGQPQTNPKVTQVTSKKEWKKSLLQQIGHVKLASLLQMSETQIANELLHGNLCGSQHFLFEHCTTLQSIEHIRDLSRPARTIKRSKVQICLQHTT
jgi:hypothetical protein